jgi:hypothetical protein
MALLETLVFRARYLRPSTGRVQETMLQCIDMDRPAAMADGRCDSGGASR